MSKKYYEYRDNNVSVFKKRKNVAFKLQKLTSLPLPLLASSQAMPAGRKKKIF
jgi:hypothetical protein